MLLSGSSFAVRQCSDMLPVVWNVGPKSQSQWKWHILEFWPDRMFWSYNLCPDSWSLQCTMLSCRVCTSGKGKEGLWRYLIHWDWDFASTSFKKYSGLCYFLWFGTFTMLWRDLCIFLFFFSSLFLPIDRPHPRTTQVMIPVWYFLFMISHCYMQSQVRKCNLHIFSWHVIS